MRTSRLSRDVSKIIAATSTRNAQRPSRDFPRPIRGRSSKRILRDNDSAELTNSQNNGGEETTETEYPSSLTRAETARPGLASASESELSDAPESDVDDAASPEGNDGGDAGRKRKRNAPIMSKTTTKTTTRIKQEALPDAPAVFSQDPPLRKDGRPRRARRAPAKKVKTEDGTVKIEPPPNWELMYALTREMRNENPAPVDTMGCESLADGVTTPRNQRYQTLTALMLSSQTKDTVTAAAIRGMQETMPGGFSLESVLVLPAPSLNALISKVGFHNLKTKYIKQTAEILRDRFDSDIPSTIEGLVSLPGVGPKMAYLCLSAAWGKTEGIGVDVHVHRITNLWGWHKTNKPEETRAALESWLPRDRWHDINNLLVGFGQAICLPVGRKCGSCRLAERGLCPSAVVEKTKVVKKETVVKVEGLEEDNEKVKVESTLVVRETAIKAENVEDMVLDIEDIGVLPKRRTSRQR